MYELFRNGGVVTLRDEAPGRSRLEPTSRIERESATWITKED